MMIPPWLANLTGANAFANNPANGFQPTMGDAAQGIGHDMMEHYRRQAATQDEALAPSGAQAPGVPGGNPTAPVGPTLTPMNPAFGPQALAPQAPAGVSPWGLSLKQILPGLMGGPLGMGQ